MVSRTCVRIPARVWNVRSTEVSVLNTPAFSKTNRPAYLNFLRAKYEASKGAVDALLEEVGEYLFLIMFYNYVEPLLNKRPASVTSTRRTSRRTPATALIPGTASGGR